jgi:hypothetical protein
MVNNFTALVLIYLALSALASARERTWTGVVSDSHCKTRHSTPSREAEACVERCVADGAEYVLVSGGQVYELTPQAAFESFAGQSVRIVGRESRGRIDVASFEPVRGTGQARAGANSSR